MSEKKRTDKVGLISAVRAVCTADVATFFRMSYQSSWRVFLQLLIFCIVIGVGSGGIKYLRNREQIHNAATVVAEKLGAITFAGNGFTFTISPEIRPERNFSISVFKDVALCYYDPQAGGESRAFVPPDESQATVIMPQIIVQLFKAPENMYFVRNVNGENSVSASGLTEYLISLDKSVQNSTTQSDLFHREFIIPAKILPKMATTFFLMLWTLGEFFTCLWTSIFFVAIFSGFWYFMRPGTKGSFGKFWNTVTYSGFPGLIIGGIFAAFEIPFLSFNMIFVITMVIYFPFMSAKMEKTSGRQT